MAYRWLQCTTLAHARLTPEVRACLAAQHTDAGSMLLTQLSDCQFIGPYPVQYACNCCVEHLECPAAKIPGVCLLTHYSLEDAD